jgi:CHAT domain-containing protein
VFLDAAAETEALNFVARSTLPWDGLLSVSRHLAHTEGECYEHLWRRKAAVLRALQHRQEALTTAVTAPDVLDVAGREQVRQIWRDLTATRHELSRVLLAPTRGEQSSGLRAQELSLRKEQLERRLAELLPAFRRARDLRREGPAALLGRLPPGTVFVDVVRYVHRERDGGAPGPDGLRQTARYAAFVLSKDNPVRRVDFGPAEPVERLLTAWRQALAERRAGPEAEALGALLWKPLADFIPAGATVLVAPDGALTGLPWGALPGRGGRGALVEDHAIAVVPDGPFLLDRLTGPAAAEKEPGLLLTVGGVEYDAEPGKPAPDAALASGRLVERGTGSRRWAYLPGTGAEVDNVLALAGKERPCCARKGAEATTARLLADLPRARWAHLATHGFFADAEFRSALRLDPSLFERRAGEERVAPGARNPFVLSGLVLAGANRPSPADAAEMLRTDGGILTAEAIAGLPLGHVELAVLSACETGLGEVAGGEGTFGLQRAFHQAGARTVVASLWKLDDQATQALMAEFYRNLWHKKLGKLEALRQAQMTVLRRYDPKGGKLRGSATRPQAVNPEELRQARERAGEPAPSVPPFYWAGFVLSGDWR